MAEKYMRKDGEMSKSESVWAYDRKRSRRESQEMVDGYYLDIAVEESWRDVERRAEKKMEADRVREERRTAEMNELIRKAMLAAGL